MKRIFNADGEPMFTDESVAELPREVPISEVCPHVIRRYEELVEALIGLPPEAWKSRALHDFMRGSILFLGFVYYLDGNFILLF